MKDNEQLTKQDSGLPSRPLTGSADAPDKDAERKTSDLEISGDDLRRFFDEASPPITTTREIQVVAQFLHFLNNR